MGRKYYGKYKHKRSKSGIAGALIAALSGRRSYHSDHYRGGHDYRGYAPYPRRRLSIKSSIISYILKRLLRRFT